MPSTIYWIGLDSPGALGVMARPRGGEWLDEEVDNLRAQGVNAVVSLLTTEEMRELELVEEGVCCERHGLDFLCLPISDRGTPPDALTFLRLLREVDARMGNGARIVVHCRQGIGRAALTATGVLLLRNLGVDEALARISTARGCPVPDTEAQRQWLHDFSRRYREMEAAEELWREMR